MKQNLQIRASLKIQKPAADVYEAIVDPDRMSGYFISASTGRIEEGKTLTWRFPEFDISFEVKVTASKPQERIAWLWDALPGEKTEVDIRLEAVSDMDT